MDTAEVVTPLLYRKGKTPRFGTADYRNIVSEQSVMGKQNRPRATLTRPATDRFRDGSAWVEHLGDNAQHV